MDDDPIVEEIDVFLSKSTNVYVVQFPIKNKGFNIDKGPVTNCCFKPIAEQLKIDFKLDTASHNYDAFKGKMLAETADGNRPTSSSYSKGDNPSFNSGRMDKTSFTSAIGMKNPRYALGMLQEETANNSKALHLVPVKTFFQMRQSYSYFDKGDKRTKAEDKGGSDDEADELKRVTCKVSRSSDPEKTKKAKERSWQHFCKVGADEAWCETMIYPKDSPQSDMERSKIPLAQHQPHLAHFTSISPNEYFNDLITDDATLNPPQEPQNGENGKEPKCTMIPGLISKKQIKKLPLLEQIKVFLKDSKVLPLHQLMEMLSDPQLSTEKVLRNLALCGVMLKGNWTLQSEMLYPAGFVSLINGVSSELMCKGRDYLLYKLMRNEMSLLNRQKISIITQLPVEETREVLESVAYLKVTDKTKVWDLLKPADIEFEIRHPEIVQRQEVFWKAQEEKFIEMEAEKSEKRTRKKSVRESKA